MNIFWVLCSLIFLVSCAGSHSGTTAKVRPKYVPLSLEDSKKLITPTVYYIPRYDQSTTACAQTVNMKAKDGSVLATVCKNVYDSCLMQGTCLIKTSGQTKLINVGSKVDGERRFVVVDQSQCFYGRGAVRDSVKTHSLMCLDPYFSVAADLKIYRLGEVIYIPSFTGVMLPDGTIHDGHFIVRDSGGSINGYGRFDFFSGFDSPKDGANPLVFHEFIDKGTHVPYFQVTGPKANEILIQRNFPRLKVLK